MKITDKVIIEPKYPNYVILAHHLLTTDIIKCAIDSMTDKANIKVKEIADIPIDEWDRLDKRLGGFKKGEISIIGTGSSFYASRYVAVYFNTPEDKMRFALTFTDDEMIEAGEAAQEKKLNEIFDKIKKERVLRKKGDLPKGRRMSRDEFQQQHMGKFTNDEE